jgi:hypothetical protein
VEELKSGRSGVVHGEVSLSRCIPDSSCPVATNSYQTNKTGIVYLVSLRRYPSTHSQAVPPPFNNESRIPLLYSTDWTIMLCGYSRRVRGRGIYRLYVVVSLPDRMRCRDRRGRRKSKGRQWQGRRDVLVLPTSAVLRRSDQFDLAAWRDVAESQYTVCFKRYTIQIENYRPDMWCHNSTASLLCKVHLQPIPQVSDIQSPGLVVPLVVLLLSGPMIPDLEKVVW